MKSSSKFMFCFIVLLLAAAALGDSGLHWSASIALVLSVGAFLCSFGYALFERNDQFKKRAAQINE